jgi:PAS domain S-box-containing protein
MCRVSGKKELEYRKVKSMSGNQNSKGPEYSESLFQAITEQSGVGISLADPDGNYIFTNGAFCKMTGYSETELKKMNLRDLVPPETELSLFQKVVKEQSEFREVELMKKDGSRFWTEIKGCPVQLKGKPFVLGIVGDITKYKKVEEELNEREAKYRSLVETTSDWIWEVGADGTYTYASPKVEEILGYHPEEIVGMTPFDLMPPEEAERIAGVFKDHVDNGKPIVTLENVCHHKNGRRVVLETSGVPVFNETGDIICYQGVDRDITRRKRNEKIRQENEAKFRILFDLSPLPIALSEAATGRIVDVNEKLCELSGFSKKELVGKRSTEMGFYTGQDREKVTSALKALGEVKGLEMDFKTKDGSFHSALMFAKTIQIGNEHLIVTVIYDITDRKRLEEQTRLIQRMETLATLSGGLAHEINNALQTVVGNIELLEMASTDNENVLQFCQNTKEPTQRIVDLINHLLAYSRGGKYETARIDMSDFVRSTVPLVIPQMGDNVLIEVDLSENLSDIKADASQLRMVLSELLLNSMEAVQDRGRIWIVTGEKEIDETFAAAHPGLSPGAYVSLVIKDDGRGMDENLKNRIFEPFFTTKSQGRGLGMSAVYGIVKNHDGYILVDSEPGKGSEVCVLMPSIENEI